MSQHCAVSALCRHCAALEVRTGRPKLLTVVALGLGWAVAVIVGWFAYRLLVERGRLLLRLDALEQRLADDAAIPSFDEIRTQGLPPGSVAPDFALPDLTGVERALESWRGRRVLLVFFDLACEFCRDLVPLLARVAAMPDASRPLPIVVATGEAAAIRRLMGAHGVSCPVLLEGDTGVSGLFHVPATPAGYLVDERGTVARPLALGAEEILSLGDSSAGVGAPTNARRGSTVRTRPLSESSLNRSGLTKGTVAPAFTLPSLDGGDLTLSDFRGSRVLLVFSDPDCVPCDSLTPALERLHRERSDLTVVVVSRGEAQANREKAQGQALTFPIVLQRHWDTSRAYGMFATPIGYLVDEEGVLLSDVAVGGDDVLALAGSPQPRAAKEVVPS